MDLRKRPGLGRRSDPTVRYLLDGQTVDSDGDRVKLDPERLGDRTLSATLKLEDGPFTMEQTVRVLSAKPPRIFDYRVVATYPHDPTAYTQGLEFAGDTLYEGTGKYGESSLRKLDFRTGEVLLERTLAPAYFGEGITLLGGTVFQLTWREGLGFRYDQGTFAPKGDFRYAESKVGWGLCNDGDQLYKSDGSDRIWILDPETQREVDHIQIVTNRGVFNRANELEYVDGTIYANVYQKQGVMLIDAKTGAIQGVVNFGGLLEQVDHSVPDWDDDNSVLNGLAFHKERGTLFVTGKNWDILFEVELIDRAGDDVSD